jgi:very-short-patch-repair endonuclease
VTADMLRGRRLEAPFFGVRVPAGGAQGLRHRCQALAVRYPDAAFSHVTAARLLDLPVPADPPHAVAAGTRLAGKDARASGLSDVAPIHLMVPPGRRAPRGRGVRGHTGLLPGDVETSAAGLLVVRAPVIWGQLAVALSLTELVVLGDASLRRGLATVTALEATASGQRHRRGTRRMRQALSLLDVRAESPMETRLRVLMVLAGLPMPAVNRDVVVDGQWLARPDLSYPDLRIAIEYEGDHHRTDRRQWRSDKRRRRLLEDAGWMVIEVTADDVFRRPDELLQRIRRACARRAA